MTPPDKKKKSLWSTGGGKNVHPKAPTGAGGGGTFTSPKPLQNQRKTNDPTAHPQSPRGKDVAPIDSTRADAVPPPPSRDMRAEMLRVSKAAVGKPVIMNPANHEGVECYDMAEKLLHDIGAKSAPDFTKSGTVGGNDNYTWGEKIKNLSDVQPGDILQIRDSEVTRTVKTTYKSLQPGNPREGSEVKTTMLRGHHTAVVIALNGDGTIQVSEQHVLNPDRTELSRTIMENTMPIVKGRKIQGDPVVSKVDSGTQQRTVTTTWEWTKGEMWPYRPVAK